jgi:formylglycine-generating enzyme required for sulfatase activity
MRKQFILAAAMMVAGLAAAGATAQGVPAKAPDGLVFVKGGTFKNTKSNYYGKGVTVSDFYIGKYLVTEKEWTAVMGSNPSKFSGDNFPVEMVTWYDSIEYCNRRSIQEGLKPYYNIDKATKDPNNLPDPHFGDLDKIKWTVTINPGANGYRLPTEAEWEYAAGGGQLSRSYTYSGSDDVDEVAWYWRNSGEMKLSGFWSWSIVQQNHDQPQPVGSKKPNELGLYDMSGNVREWCWDWDGDLQTNVSDPKGSPSGFRRIWRGGGWMGDAPFTEPSFRGSLAANGKGPDQGFRLCRNR